MSAVIFTDPEVCPYCENEEIIDGANNAGPFFAMMGAAITQQRYLSVDTDKG